MKAAELVKSLESKSCEEQLRDLQVFDQQKRRVRGDLIPVYSFMKDLLVRGWSASSPRLRETG